VYLVSYLYKGGPAPNPIYAGNANGEGVVNVGDVVYLVSYLYKGGPPPVPFNSVVDFKYNADSTLQKIIYGSWGDPPARVEDVFAYTSKLQMESIWTIRDGDASDPLFGRVYGYDNVNNLFRMFAYDSSSGAPHMMYYNYDDLDRLTTVTVDDSIERSFTYDEFGLGNRKSVNGVPYTYYQDQNNHDMSRLQHDGVYDYDYDDNGNMETRIGPEGTTTYAWDCANNLVQINYAGGGSSTFVYDESGRRIKKTDPDGTVTYYIYSGGSVICTESTDGTGTTEYYYANGKLRASSGDNNHEHIYYHHSDYLGTTRLVTSSLGEVSGRFDNHPFGEPLSLEDPGDPGRFTFTGKEQDEDSGLYYFNARYYDSETGRFISPDPIASYSNPYSYCANNPLKYVDPTGMAHGPWRDIPGVNEPIVGEWGCKPSSEGFWDFAIDLYLHCVVPFDSDPTKKGDQPWKGAFGFYDYDYGSGKPAWLEHYEMKWHEYYWALAQASKKPPRTIPKLRGGPDPHALRQVEFIEEGNSYEDTSSAGEINDAEVTYHDGSNGPIPDWYITAYTNAYPIVLEGTTVVGHRTSSLPQTWGDVTIYESVSVNYIETGWVIPTMPLLLQLEGITPSAIQANLNYARSRGAQGLPSWQEVYNAELFRINSGYLNPIRY
jgi:RHS repeat-associated protein